MKEGEVFIVVKNYRNRKRRSVIPRRKIIPPPINVQTRRMARVASKKLNKDQIENHQEEHSFDLPYEEEFQKNLDCSMDNELKQFDLFNSSYIQARSSMMDEIDGVNNSSNYLLL